MPLMTSLYRVAEATSRPRKERRTEHESTWQRDDDDDDTHDDDSPSNSYSFNASPTPAKRNGNTEPCAKALYDFEPGQYLRTMSYCIVK